MGSGWLDAPRGAVEERVVRVAGEDVVQYRVDRPTGAAKVQVFDARTGKIVDQHEQSNFISRLWAFSARGWQRFGWSTYPINPITDIEAVPGGYAVGRPPFLFPNHALAAWNDSSAEDPMTEHRIETDSQGLVAYATRNPVGSPNNRRGTVNVSDSYWNDQVEHQVYDWPTTAGNGTFRSVGYTTAIIGETFGRFHLRPSFADRRWFYVSGDWSSVVYGSAQTTPVMGTSKVDANGDLVIPCRVSGSSGKFAIAKIPAASLVYAGLVQNALGAAEREVTLSVPFNNSTALNTGASSGANGLICFLGEYDGYYWFTGPGTSTGQLVRVHKSTGVGDRNVASSNFGTGTSGNGTNAQGCIIGSNAFIFGSGTNPALYRYDLTENPPSLSATITPSYPTLVPSSGQITSCFTDGTDIYAYHATAGLLKFNTSGGLVQEYGIIATGVSGENGSSPYSSTSYAPGGSLYEPIKMYRYQSGSATEHPFSTNTATTPTYRGRSFDSCCLMWFENDIHMVPFGLVGSPNSVVAGIMQAGWNMGSRSLLDSDVTKTSGNTMKITYTITLPDIV